MAIGFGIKHFTSSNSWGGGTLKLSLYISDAVRIHIFTLSSIFLISLYNSYQKDHSSELPSLPNHEINIGVSAANPVCSGGAGGIGSIAIQLATTTARM